MQAEIIKLKEEIKELKKDLAIAIVAGETLTIFTDVDQEVITNKKMVKRQHEKLLKLSDKYDGVL